MHVHGAVVAVGAELVAEAAGEGVVVAGVAGAAGRAGGDHGGDGVGWWRDG